MQSQVSLFNARLSVALLVIVPWLAVRNEIDFISSSLRVPLEWCALIAFTAILPKVRGLPARVETPIAILLLALIFYSILSKSDLPDWPMYWRGFGPRVAIGALVLAIILISLVVLDSAGRIELRRLVNSEEFRRWNRRIGITASFWLVPSILQPMDAWLNIGDTTQIVLEEISGWAVGHIPGYQQASGYSSMLGAPLLALSALGGRDASKLTIIVLWANLLVLFVPIMIAAILRRMFSWLTMPATFAVALVSVLISGDSLGENEFYNTSIFRELSFVSRLLPPLLLAYVLVRTSKLQELRAQQVALLAVVAGVVALNNFEFGFGAAGAAAVTLAVLIRKQRNRRGLLIQWWVIFSVVWLVALAPALWIDGSVIRRRLGAFILLILQKPDVYDVRGDNQLPIFGLITICLAVSLAATGIAFCSLNGRETTPEARVSAVVALFISLWTLFSTPYVLMSGGGGAFGAQLYFVPLGLIAMALLKLLQLNNDESITLHCKELGRATVPSVKRVASLFPIFLLVGLVFSAIQQVPAGHREWRRIQTPIANEKWVDEWSTERLDWIELSRVVKLVEPFGGVEKVGWWYQHGSAIEVLTGVENLLGVSAVDAIRTNLVLELACEPLVSSSKPYVIALSGSKSTLDQCEGLEVRQLASDDQLPLAIFEVIRNR